MRVDAGPARAGAGAWRPGPSRRVTSWALLVFAPAVVALAASAPLTAQTLVGRVLDDARESPVAGALVRLLDRDGKERARALADSEGRFALGPPKAGEYYLEATSLGYQRTLSPLLAFTQGQGTAAVDLMMVPAPIGLEGLSVEVDAATRATRDLDLLGIAPADLGSSWITQAEIDAIEIKQDVGVIMEWQGISGLRVVRPENIQRTPTPGDLSEPLGLCISLVRGRTWQGSNTCALAVVNGIPTTNEHLLDLDPLTVSAIAVLQPIEALVLFGKKAEGGAVLIWTRQGGGR